LNDHAQASLATINLFETSICCEISGSFARTVTIAGPGNPDRHWIWLPAILRNCQAGGFRRLFDRRTPKALPAEHQHSGIENAGTRAHLTILTKLEEVSNNEIAN